MHSEIFKHIRVRISGETAGTGASTVAKILAHELGILRFDGGVYWRAFARDFIRFKYANGYIDDYQAYRDFIFAYEFAYIAYGFRGVFNLLKSRTDRTLANNQEMDYFHALVKEDTKRGGPVLPLWDVAIEQLNAYTAASEGVPFIHESKFAVLFMKFDKFAAIAEIENSFALPVLDILLTVDPEIAAQRVVDREGNLVSAQEILHRAEFDFERLTECNINGVPVNHSMLRTEVGDENIIPTDELDPYEVAREIILRYIRMVQASDSKPIFATELIAQLEQVVDSLTEQSEAYKKSGKQAWRDLEVQRIDTFDQQMKAMEQQAEDELPDQERAELIRQRLREFTLKP